MIIFFAGDVHGRLTQFYDKVFSLENKLGLQADWILQTGNFGVWPDPLKIDRATRQHIDNVDFHRYYYNGLAVPKPTLFIAGRHEDHRWLNFKRDRGEMEILPNLNWLLNGFKTSIGLNVVGLGKSYSPKTYYDKKSRKALGHYTRSDVERACSQGPTDILLTHEAPKGLQLGGHISEAEGIEKICFATRPTLLVHGHYNYSADFYLHKTNTKIVSLGYMEIRPFLFRDRQISALNG
jgi:Icc-related predicted phosphoesterase